ncbi:MAG: flagellar hook-length control protein FliK [Clostridiales bacterium]|nr:flagellar hook-length control protein FliK [Clostridiales bacterium]
MLAGQAISNNVMDFFSTAGTNAKTAADHNTSNTKNDISFDKLLSRSAIAGRAQNKEDLSQPTTSNGSARKLTKNSNASKQPSRKTNDVVNKLISDNAKGSQVTESASTSKVDVKSPSEKVASVVKEVKKEVMKILDISEEELVNMMQMLGLGMMELLNPDTLKTLVLEQAGVTDASMLLTEDGLGQQLHQLIEKVNELFQEVGLTTEYISSLLEQPEEFDRKMELLKNSVSDKQGLVETTQKPEDFETFNSDKESENSIDREQESNIQFTVVKEDKSKSEISSSTTSSDSRQSEAQGKTETTMANQFVDQMINASAKLEEASFSENLREIHDLREIVHQVVKEIKVTIKPEQTSMDIHLNPEHLGRVALNITTKNGVLTASFTTQTEVAREAIESQIQTLRDSLSNQGIKVEAIEVNVSEFSFQQENSMGQDTNQQQKQTSSSKRPFRMNAGEEFVTSQQEGSEVTTAIDSGSSIDYSA